MTEANEVTDAGANEVTDAETDELTDAETDKLTDAETDKLTDAETDELTDAETDELTDAEANEVTDAETDELTDAETDELTDAEANEVTDAETDELTDADGSVSPRRRWPASKRARAARRRARARAEVRLRRQVLRRRVRRRRAAVVVALAATTGLGAGLAFAGLSLVRNSTAGEAVPTPPTPEEPGYEALVIPTPTLLVVHEGAEGDLAGVTLLTLHPDDEGGSVVLIPPSVRLPFGDQGEVTAEETYRQGGGGAVRGLVGTLLGIVVEDHVVLDDDRWASLTGPVAPLSVPLAEPVGEWPAGDVPLAAEEVGPFLSALDPDESQLDRLARHAELWEAWLPEVRATGAGAVPGEVAVGIGRFVRGLAADDAAVVGLPVTPVDPDDAGSVVAADGIAGDTGDVSDTGDQGDDTGDVSDTGDEGDEAGVSDIDDGGTEPGETIDDGGTEFALDETRAAELVASAVPFPVSPGPDTRLRLRLLNGTIDDRVVPAAGRRLVEAGAAIAVTGNASSFDVTETTFAYRPGVSRDDVERLAEVFGVGNVEQADPPGSASGAAEGAEADIDVTLVLGRDAQDLIRRLDNADG